MTTPITAQPHESPAREPLPPVEHDRAEGVMKPPPPESQHEAQNQPGDEPGKIAKSVAHWIHKHPEAHKSSLFGRTVYQFARSFVASIPYGLSMAAVLAGFTKMDQFGTHLETKGASAVTQRLGKGIGGFARFQPAKMAALIGASFTFYRGTSKLGKWMTEYLFNPKDTEARTAEKVSDLPEEAWRKVKEIAPAEYSSTPISAVVLGFIVSAFNPPFDKDKNLLVKVKEGTQVVEKNIAWTRKNFLETAGSMNKLKLLGHSIIHPSAKFIPQALINVAGYSWFFELGDRLFKDVQIRRGVWPGEHHSIKALKAAPDEYEQGIKDGNQAANRQKYEDSAAEAVPDKNHYGFFTAEPSLGRFLFRRVLPTAVGITAYTAFKMRWATMVGNHFAYDKGITGGQFFKKAWGEGAATSLFFLIPIVTEPWEKWYDNFFEKKEKIAQMKEHPERYVRTLTPHQEGKYDELLQRVTEKEKSAANDGQYAQRA